MPGGIEIDKDFDKFAFGKPERRKISNMENYNKWVADVKQAQKIAKINEQNNLDIREMLAASERAVSAAGRCAFGDVLRETQNVRYHIFEVINNIPGSERHLEGILDRFDGMGLFPAISEAFSEHCECKFMR